MQVHDPDALEMLLESSHGRRESLSGVVGAVPAKRRGVPSAKPLAPRARERAATRREPAGVHRERHAERSAASPITSSRLRPRTAPARGWSSPAAERVAERSAGPEGATALGHTQNLGLKRTFFWPTKVIAVERIEPIGYRSTVGRESDRVGFWEAGQSGPPGGYSRAPLPAGRKPRSANEVYGYTRRLTAAEQRERRKEERERARTQASTSMLADGVFADEISDLAPEPEPEPETPSAQKGAMIYVNTKEAGMQIHYSAHPDAPVHVKVSQFSPTKPQSHQEQSSKLPEVIPEDMESTEELHSVQADVPV
jgi:hypothetical protein